mmetsp:Transcript_55461/g.144691  ORF Transcript_55461/g.144691 Transcript_55461/m.144691 type:complete len:266 (+) Transcript_55461:892-1689(+)
MLLLFQHENYITGICVRVLIGHLTEGDLVLVWRAFLDVHLQHLALLLRLETLAIAAAGATLRLHLLDHWSHADDLNLHTAAVAIAALLHAALLVNDLTSDGHLLRRTIVHLLKCHLQRLHDVLGLLALSSTRTTSAPTTSEEGIKDVRRVTATAATLLQTLLAEPVVLGALVRVAQHLVGTGDLLELLRVATLVGMVLHRELAVGLLDVGLRSALVHIQGFVELLRVHRLTPSSTWSATAREVAAGHSREPPEKHGNGERCLTQI